jgi:hypothetical protein
VCGYCGSIGFTSEAGILSGIIGGIIVGSFTGSPLQVSGPAAGLIINVHEIVSMQGLQALGVIVFLSVHPDCFRTFQNGSLFRAFTCHYPRNALRHRFVYLVGQMYVMLDATPQKTFIDNLKYLPAIIKSGLFQTGEANHHIAAMVGAATIIIIILWG